MEAASQALDNLTRIGRFLFSVYLPSLTQSRIDWSEIGGHRSASMGTIFSMSLARRELGFVPFGLSGMPYTTKLNLPSRRSNSCLSELVCVGELGVRSSLLLDSLEDSWLCCG